MNTMSAGAFKQGCLTAWPSESPLDVAGAPAAELPVVPLAPDDVAVLLPPLPACAAEPVLLVAAAVEPAAPDAGAAPVVMVIVAVMALPLGLVATEPALAAVIAVLRAGDPALALAIGADVAVDMTGGVMTEESSALEHAAPLKHTSTSQFDRGVI